MTLDPNKTYFHKEYLNQKYKFSIFKKNNELKIELVVDNNKITRPNPQEGFGLSVFTNEELEKMFMIFLKDIFHYSNFNKLNNGIKIVTNIDDLSNGLNTRITAIVLFQIGSTPYVV